MHWAVPVDVMRALVPDELELDTFEGRTYIGVVPFRMSGVRLRFTPALPGIGAFPELNVRTYVTCDGKPGVFFFSLDATNAIAVAAARAWFKLPYMRARMSLDPERDGWVHYKCERTHKREPPAEFIARYGPTGDVYTAAAGTLDHWLTERYCLYTVDRRHRVRRAEVHHATWPLQPAECEVETNTMTASLGLDHGGATPLLHFARFMDVVVWLPRRL